MTTRTTLAALCAASLTATLAGCASHPAPHHSWDAAAATASATPTPSSSPAPADTVAWTPASNNSSCAIYLYGHDARIQVTTGSGNDPTPECHTLSASLAGNGTFWTTQQVITSDQLAVVCAASQGDLTAVIRDAGTQAYGQQVCAGLLQSGWTENSQAEAQAQQQDAAQASVQAQASAQADAQAAAQNAVNTLVQMNNGFTDAKALRDDVSTADTDLASEKADARNGNGDYCNNISVTVSNDATVTVGNDVNVSGSNDADREQQGIDATRTDINAILQADATLQADGLPAPDGADAAITTAQRQLAEALATANGAIDSLNADLDEAYRVANHAGTGDCASDGPGAAPSGLAHLK